MRGPEQGSCRRGPPAMSRTWAVRVLAQARSGRPTGQLAGRQRLCPTSTRKRVVDGRVVGAERDYAAADEPRWRRARAAGA